MTPTNLPPGSSFNSSPSPKPSGAAWQVWAMRIISVAIALYMIFGVALPNARERMKDDHGQSPSASAPAH